MLIQLYSHYTLLNVSALEGLSSGSTDTYREKNPQNTRPDVNSRLKSNVLYVTQQLSSCYVRI
jgi:hypothetical protein